MRKKFVGFWHSQRGFYVINHVMFFFINVHKQNFITLVSLQVLSSSKISSFFPSYKKSAAHDFEKFIFATVCGIGSEINSLWQRQIIVFFNYCLKYEPAFIKRSSHLENKSATEWRPTSFCFFLSLKKKGALLNNC